MMTDPEFPFSVDIPIPRSGLGPMLPVILDAARACPEGAEVKVFALPPHAEVRQWWHRIVTKNQEDAQRLYITFRSLGAQEVRMDGN